METSGRLHSGLGWTGAHGRLFVEHGNRLGGPALGRGRRDDGGSGRRDGWVGSQQEELATLKATAKVKVSMKTALQTGELSSQGDLRSPYWPRSS